MVLQCNIRVISATRVICKRVIGHWPAASFNLWDRWDAKDWPWKGQVNSAPGSARGKRSPANPQRYFKNRSSGLRVNDHLRATDMNPGSLFFKFFGWQSWLPDYWPESTHWNFFPWCGNNNSFALFLIFTMATTLWNKKKSFSQQRIDNLIWWW